MVIAIKHLEGNRSGATERFDTTGVRFGRDENTCHCLFPGVECVSAQHAVLTRSEDGRYLLKDLGSTNGTFVNDRRIILETVEVGDELRFGLHGPVLQITELSATITEPPLREAPAPAPMKSASPPPRPAPKPRRKLEVPQVRAPAAFPINRVLGAAALGFVLLVSFGVAGRMIDTPQPANSAQHDAGPVPTAPSQGAQQAAAAKPGLVGIPVLEGGSSASPTARTRAQGGTRHEPEQELTPEGSAPKKSPTPEERLQAAVDRAMPSIVQFHVWLNIQAPTLKHFEAYGPALCIGGRYLVVHKDLVEFPAEREGWAEAMDAAKSSGTRFSIMRMVVTSSTATREMSVTDADGLPVPDPAKVFLIEGRGMWKHTQIGQLIVFRIEKSRPGLVLGTAAPSGLARVINADRRTTATGEDGGALKIARTNTESLFVGSPPRVSGARSNRWLGAPVIGEDGLVGIVTRISSGKGKGLRIEEIQSAATLQSLF